MTIDQPHDVGEPAETHDPMAEFRARFAEIRALMERQIAKQDRTQLSVRSEVFEKVRDMVRGQIMLFHAERALDEEFKRLQRGHDAGDAAALRDQIGRKLDRIRASLLSEEVPSEPEET